MDVDEVISDALSHHGVKGQKWGVKKDRTTNLPTQQKNSTAPASADASGARSTHGQIKEHGTAVLSNKELKALVERMNLEQQYSNLSKASKKGPKKEVDDFIKQQGKQHANKVISEVVGKVLLGALKG